MCRLFGFRSAVPSRTHRSLILAQNSLAHQALQHRHGWGIGHYPGGGAPEVLNSVAPASECPVFREASRSLSARTFVVHVRKATVGRIAAENLHPFVCGQWMFAHNGTIHGFSEVRPWLRERGLPGREPAGETDSEALFLYLLGELARAGLAAPAPGPTDPERPAAIGRCLAAALDALETEIRWRAIAPAALNFLLTDGALFLGNRRGRELWFSTQKRHCADALTCPEASKPCLLRERPAQAEVPVNHLLIASEPIGEEDIWEEVPEGQMVLVGPDFRLHRI